MCLSICYKGFTVQSELLLPKLLPSWRLITKHATNSNHIHHHLCYFVWYRLGSLNLKMQFFNCTAAVLRTAISMVCCITYKWIVCEQELVSLEHCISHVLYLRISSTLFGYKPSTWPQDHVLHHLKALHLLLCLCNPLHCFNSLCQTQQVSTQPSTDNGLCPTGRPSSRLWLAWLTRTHLAPRPWPREKHPVWISSNSYWLGPTQILVRDTHPKVSAYMSVCVTICPLAQSTCLTAALSRSTFLSFCLV